MRPLLLVIFTFFFPSCLSVGPAFDEEVWRRQVEGSDVSALYAPHFSSERFVNPWMASPDRGLLGLVRWKLSKGREYSRAEEEYLPRALPGLAARIAGAGKGDFIAWVGHATFLMRLSGQYWITDPIFSERALLPKRRIPPAITAAEIAGFASPLNILLSHNHYDHLDRASIRSLPPDARAYVPLGLKGYVEGMDKRSVQELDWWQSVETGGGIKLICLPAQHWSRRFGQGTNSTLWASYLVVTPDVTIYFGGDSGYFKGFREFGKQFPGIDYAILPITAYHPRWFMHYAHVDVNEALDAFEDLHARNLIPMQWGTFRLGDEPPGYPALELRRRAGERGIDPSRVMIMEIGQLIPLARNPQPWQKNHPP